MTVGSAQNRRFWFWNKKSDLKFHENNMLKMVIKAFHASNFLLVNQTINARAQNNRKRQNQISHLFALSAQKSEKQSRSKSRLPNLTLGEWPVKLNLTHF